LFRLTRLNLTTLSFRPTGDPRTILEQAKQIS